MSWLQKLRDYAPDIAMAVATGGATLPQLAAKAVGDALGTDVKDQGQLQQVVQNASPEQMARIQEANHAFKIRMRELDVEQQKARLEDIQKEHQTTQDTIQTGDKAVDKAVRMVRPTMAKQSWMATIAYCLGSMLFDAFNGTDIFSFEIASLLASPAWAYMGLRQLGKVTDTIATKTISN